MLDDFLNVTSGLLLDALDIIFKYYLIWLPLFLIFIFWTFWLRYIRALFIFEEETILLEIKLPREILKSPRAMELFLTNLHQTGGEGTPWKRYWLGKVRAWFSLELVSIEGQVKFFIWTRVKLREIVETQIYAQYPTVEVSEASDYSLALHYDPEKVTMFGSEFELTKEDPYPIKTYVDYGLESDPKEELKVDPISNVLEFLGSMGRGEQAWIQIIVRAHKGRKLTDRFFFWNKKQDWKEEGEELVQKLMKRDIEQETREVFRPTEGEREVIKAIERSISKFGFDCGIRGIYIAESEIFRKVNIGGLLGSVKQYSSLNLNGFKPSLKTDFDYPWEDFKEKRLSKRKVKMLDAYRRRAYFYPPYRKKSFVLNTEELATIYHFPGEVVATPTLERMESKKAEAPTNLPT